MQPGVSGGYGGTSAFGMSALVVFGLRGPRNNPSPSPFSCLTKMLITLWFPVIVAKQGLLSFVCCFVGLRPVSVCLPLAMPGHCSLSGADDVCNG